MTNIKPISDLRNYTEVLSEVAENSPVYLTRKWENAIGALLLKRTHGIFILFFA